MNCRPAGAALTQVFLRQLEAVAAILHHGQPVLPLLGGILGNENAKRLVRTAPDASPELMQLRQPKPIGILDQHDRGVGDVHPYLDHAGGKQRLDFARQKTADHCLLFVRF